MARAYKKTYLNGAMHNLAVMMDCGVRKYGYPIGEFYEKFLSSDVSRQFGTGNPRYLVGMSGAELADLVVQSSGDPVSDKNDGTYTVGPEYWAGWVLAYYQWLTRRSFAFIQHKGLGIKDVVSMYYPPLHEADLSKFAAAANNIIQAKRGSNYFCALCALTLLTHSGYSLKTFRALCDFRVSFYSHLLRGSA